MNHSRKPSLPKPRSSRGYIVFAFIFTFAAIAAWLSLNRDNIAEFRETYKSREAAREKIVQTKELITKLKRQQQSLNSNGLESLKQIRERLGMHLPGEQVVFFETESITSGTSTKATVTTTPPSAP